MPVRSRTQTVSPRRASMVGRGEPASFHRTVKDYRAAVDRVYADDPNYDEEVDAELGTLARRLAPTLSRGFVRSREQKDALKPVGVLQL